MKLLFYGLLYIAIYLLEILLRAGEMAQRIKALVTHPDDLSSIPERSEPSPESSLTMACAPTHLPTHAHQTHTHTYMYITHTHSLNK